MLTDAIFRALVESLPDAVVIADRAGQIMLVNAQAEALFGYERAELINQPVESAPGSDTTLRVRMPVGN